MNFERPWHWQKFAPNLGDNLELQADQLTLELAVGLTKVELEAFHRAQFDARETPEREVLKVLLAEVKEQLQVKPVIEGAPSTSGVSISVGAAPSLMFDATAQLAVKVRVDEAIAKADAAYVAKLAAAWAPFVRLGPGSHAINGKPLAGLGDYLGFVCAQAGRYNLLELVEEMKRLNSVEGTRALFSEPPSGGVTSTQPRSAGKSGSQTAGR